MKIRKFEGNSARNPAELLQKYGIGRIKDGTVFDIRQIPERDREGLLADYKDAIRRKETLAKVVEGMLTRLNVRESRQDPLKDIVTGLNEAISRTANQILFHGSKNPQESSYAFDELNMLLSVAAQAIEHPNIKGKQVVNENTIYELDPNLNDVEHRTITAVEALFSHRNIAWNITSTSPYSAKEPTKAGIRLDWGPLYKVTSKGDIDKSRTEWRVAFDISGHNIDKVMNQYSLRGHHFPDVFEYKIGLLVPGLAKAMKEHYESFLKAE